MGNNDLTNTNTNSRLQNNESAALVKVSTDGIPKLFCSFCNKGLLSLNGYVKHIKKHESPGGFLCRYCDSRFCTEEELKRHRESTHITIACRLCKNMNFSNADDYRTHIRIEHNGVDRELFTCDKCGAEYKTIEPYRRHINTECGTIKPHKCDQCSMSFVTKYNLKQHKELHEGGSKYCCSYCGKKFLQKGRLVEHERSHTGEKPYKCDVCGKSFAHRESIVTHTTIHTGIRLVECRCCQSRFSCYSNLIKHRRARSDTCGLPEYNPPRNRIRKHSSRIPATINPTSEIRVSNVNKIIKPDDQEKLNHTKRESSGDKIKVNSHDHSNKESKKSQSSLVKDPIKVANEVENDCTTVCNHINSHFNSLRKLDANKEENNRQLRVTSSATITLNKRSKVQTEYIVGGDYDAVNNNKKLSVQSNDDSNNLCETIQYDCQLVKPLTNLTRKEETHHENHHSVVITNRSRSRSNSLNRFECFSVKRSAQLTTASTAAKVEKDTKAEIKSPSTDVKYENIEKNDQILSEDCLNNIFSNVPNGYLEDENIPLKHYYEKQKRRKGNRAKPNHSPITSDTVEERELIIVNNEINTGVAKDEDNHLPSALKENVLNINPNTLSDVHLNTCKVLLEDITERFPNLKTCRSINISRHNKATRKRNCEPQSKISNKTTVRRRRTKTTIKKRKRTQLNKDSDEDKYKDDKKSFRLAKISQRELKERLQITKRQEKHWKCPHCIKIYYMKKPYEKHLRDDHERSEEEIREILKIDEVTVAAEGAFKCPVCSKIYLMEKRLLDHIEKHGQDGKLIYKCPCYCSLYFATRDEATKHAQSQHKSILWCELCQKFMTGHDALKSHVARVHGIKKKPHNSANNNNNKNHNKRNFICDKCGRKFLGRTQLTDHVRSDCGRLPIYQCTECGKYLTTAGILKTHILLHKNDCPYKCEKCGKTFKIKAQYKSHLKYRHSDEKHFKCHLCPKAYPYRESLLTHMTVHTGIKRFQCNGCGKRFTCVSNLQAHRKVQADSCGLLPLNAKATQYMGVQKGNLLMGAKPEAGLDYVETNTLLAREVLNQNFPMAQVVSSQHEAEPETESTSTGNTLTLPTIPPTTALTILTSPAASSSSIIYDGYLVRNNNNSEKTLSIYN